MTIKEAMKITGERLRFGFGNHIEAVALMELRESFLVLNPMVDPTTIPDSADRDWLERRIDETRWNPRIANRLRESEKVADDDN